MSDHEPILTQLDINTYSAELFPHGALVLIHNARKDEIVLSPQATYDLLAFLRQYEAQLYQTIRKPVEVHSLWTDHVTIHQPIDNQEEIYQTQKNDHLFGDETDPPLNPLLYGDETDPLLLFVYNLVLMWVEEAYNGEARVTQIDHVPFETKQCEPDEPEMFLRFRTWEVPQGRPDQAWCVTIEPSNDAINHLYVHRYGDVLYTGRSENHSGRPYYLRIDDDILNNKQVSGSSL